MIAAAPAMAAFPIYTSPGTEAPGFSSFFSSSNGSVKVWFAGSSAAYDSILGVKVNGMDRGTALPNHASALGQLYNFGPVAAGDTLEFYLNVITTGKTYSSSAGNNPDGKVHAYFAPYAGGDFGIPAGSYFGFEDIYGGGDLDYNDYQFVVLNRDIPGVPEPTSWGLMILGFGAIGTSMRRRVAKVRVSYS